MTWRDSLRTVTMPDGRRLIGASFRGVPFFVESVERLGGRRAVVHEFPRREDPYVDDMGRRARVFPIEAYVLGDGYVAQRDSLLTALEDVAGPGQLVHPYYGVRRAVCTALSVKESAAEGGMARFSLEFTEAPTQEVTPSEVSDLPGAVSKSADTALSATETEFESGYSVAGMPAFAVASAAETLRACAQAVAVALGPVISVTEELAAVNAQLTILTAEAASLVRRPAEILGGFRAMLTAVTQTAIGAPAAVLQALVAAYSVDLGPEPPATTATRERELANRRALAGALRRILTIEAARLAPRADYQSIDYAVATRDQIADQLEEQAAEASDAAYPALVQLRADVVRAVPSDALAARILTVSRLVPVPSILLAYQLYGSVDQEEDIVARNRPRHPGFMAGDIEVLSDG